MGVRVEDLVTPEYLTGVCRREGIVDGGGMAEDADADGFGALKVKLNEEDEEMCLIDIGHASVLVRLVGERKCSGLTFSESSFWLLKASTEGARRRFAEVFSVGLDTEAAIFPLTDNALGVLFTPRQTSVSRQSSQWG